MSRRQILIILGAWVMVFLFIGLPSYLDRILSVIVGAIIIVSALKIRPPEKVVSPDRMPYVERKNSVPEHVGDDESMISNTHSPLAS